MLYFELESVHFVAIIPRYRWCKRNQALVTSERYVSQSYFVATHTWIILGVHSVSDCIPRLYAALILFYFRRFFVLACQLYGMFEVCWSLVAIRVGKMVQRNLGVHIFVEDLNFILHYVMSQLALGTQHVEGVARTLRQTIIND